MSTIQPSKKDPIIDSARIGRMIVKVFAGIVALGVWYIKIKGDIFVDVIKSFSADLILQITMILYYLSWIFGVTNDIGEQEKVLIYEKKANTGIQFIGMLIIIAVLFSLLCLTQEFIQRALILVVFFIINFFVHRYYNSSIAGPVITYSLDRYSNQHNYFMIKKTNKINDYLTSPLLLYRLWVGVGILVVFTIILITPIDQYIEIKIINYSKDFIYSIMFFILILVSEAIIWIKRIELKFSLKTINEINVDYTNGKNSFQ